MHTEYRARGFPIVQFDLQMQTARFSNFCRAHVLALVYLDHRPHSMVHLRLQKCTRLCVESLHCRRHQSCCSNCSGCANTDPSCALCTLTWHVLAARAQISHGQNGPKSSICALSAFRIVHTWFCIVNVVLADI